MKLKLLLISFISVINYAQEINAELPVLSPQSPTTSDLGKYGEIQVNESTGVISPSIPLFDYNAGKMSIPITLNYSGNGVRVNQDPTWAGVNWNINPGGVITRTVNDLADEITPNSHRLYYSEQELENLSGVRQISNGHNLNTSTEWYIEMDFLANPTVDSEVDIFNYNFLGYSGSFYIDIDNVAHLIKYDKEVSILFQNDSNDSNKSEIIIKTPDGNIFYFGGINASESSKSYPNNGAGSSVNVHFVQNAFYLHTISFFNGGTVTFEYENHSMLNSPFPIGIQESASVSQPLGSNPCNKKTKVLINEIENMVFLSKITNSFNDSEVEFETQRTGINNRLIKLNTVYLRNQGYTKKVKLNYLHIENESNTPMNEFSEEDKYFLQSVDFYGSNIFEYKYELTYTEPENFPSKKSFAQDDLGYYNGKTTNTTLLPITDIVLLNENCTFGLADREASLYYSLIGSLQKIKYPTGGYTEFEYELPYKGKKDVIESHHFSAYFRNEDSDFDSSTYGQQGNYHTYSTTYYPYSNSSPMVLTSNKTITANIDITAIAPFSHQSNVTFYVLKKNSLGSFQVFASKSQQLTNSENTTEYYSLSENFSLPAGNYIFKLSVNLITADNSSIHSVIATAELKIPNSTRNEYYPGLRIKRVRSYSNDDLSDANNSLGSFEFLNSNVTRYYYCNLRSVQKPDLINFMFEPKYVQKTWRLKSEEANGAFTDVYNLNTNSLNNVFNNDIGSYIYENITISYGGDNFENGGKELTFIKKPNYNPTLYYSHPNMFEGVFVYGTYFVGSGSFLNDGNVGESTGLMVDYGQNLNLDLTTMTSVSSNNSYENSTLIKERIFNKNYKTLNSTVYNYEGTEINSGNNIKVANLVIVPSVGSRNITYNSYLMYQKKSYNYRLVSTETKEYFGSNFTNEISSTTNFTYAPDKVSLPSVIETVNSAGDSKSTNLYYPSDVSSLNYDSTDIAIINNMQNIQHNVSQVIRSESFEGSSLLDSKQIYFNAQGLPRTISSSKGQNNLEERVVIHSYFYGKPALVSLKDGTKIKYEYNSNLQVVLKIENYGGGELDLDPIDPDNLPVINNPNSTTSTSPCHFQDMYPESMVTSYEYDNVTNNLIKITDPKCNFTTYHYDAFNRLEFVKDKDGNILSENEYHYKN